MLNRKTVLLRAAVPVAVLALTLSACGGSDSGTADKADAGKSKSEPQKAEAPSKELQAGEDATSAFKEDDGKITYSVLAQKVDVGTEAETKKLVNDPADAKGLVPVVAYVKYTNKAGGVVSKYPGVGDNVEIYADGTRGSVLIGAADDAPGCESDNDIENWKKGQSHIICETYMVPKATKELAVHWAANDDDEDPYIWKFKAA
ncbi:hypothetical protein [Streptomyces sp. H27-D2]|uniref:hypothetical protein n=1 Tax=Streptomyces sp. H27-D2 TaxID=3046304 RepID=UPI002DBCFE7B|nr:hypothetical protein [Streptomyces sp. H27-D2]MEC4015365.1 hypothetical protein [Streptomyces sp. H27-D2]